MLVRYLIPTIFIDTWIWFDTRYSILDTFVVNVISSTYSGATWNDCAIKKSIKKKIFKKKLWDIAGKTKSRIFSRKCDFFRRCDFFLENAIFFLPKIRIFSKTYEIRRVILCYILLFENIRNPVFGHFPSFPASSFMPRVTYLQYLTQCGVKPGLYSVRRSTQTELRKRIYADTSIMAFILLRRSRRVDRYVRVL